MYNGTYVRTFVHMIVESLCNYQFNDIIEELEILCTQSSTFDIRVGVVCLKCMCCVPQVHVLCASSACAVYDKYMSCV